MYSIMNKYNSHRTLHNYTTVLVFFDSTYQFCIHCVEQDIYFATGQMLLVTQYFHSNGAFNFALETDQYNSPEQCFRSR